MGKFYSEDTNGEDSTPLTDIITANMNDKAKSMQSMLPRLLQPPEIAIKRGSIINLRFLTGRSAVVLSGMSSLKASGSMDKIETYLKSANMEVNWIKGLSGEPTVSRVRETAAQISKLEPDWIVACGGGSVLDHSKLAWALYEHQGLELVDYSTPYTLPALRTKCRFVTIPTTSGSGSEVSVVGVVNDEDRPRKIPIVSRDFIPDIAILDPLLTAGLPADLTVCTAIDAFTHAIESYCSTAHNQMTDQYALVAGKIIVDNLQAVVENPADLDARERLQIAATMAGIAQNSTSGGASHALAHALGVTTNLNHGHCNAIVLSQVLQANAEFSPRPEMFVREIGLGSLEKISTWISMVAASSHLSLRWGDNLISMEHAKLESIAEIALADVCLRTNPRKMILEELSTILENTK